MVRSKNAVADGVLCDECGARLRWHEAYICDVCAGITEEDGHIQTEGESEEPAVHP